MKAIKFKNKIENNKVTLPANCVLLFHKSFDGVELEKNTIIEIITSLYLDVEKIEDEYIIGDIYDLLDFSGYLFLENISEDKNLNEAAILNILSSKLEDQYKDSIEFINI